MSILRPNPKFDGMPMSTRVACILSNLGVENLRQLIKLTDYELLRESNFGRKSLNELESALSKRRLRLSKSVHWQGPQNTPEGQKLFRKYQIARLKWEIYRDKYKLGLVK